MQSCTLPLPLPLIYWLRRTQNPVISILTRNCWGLSHLRRQNCWFMSSNGGNPCNLGFEKNWTSDLLNCWYWSIIQLCKALKASWDYENIWRERTFLFCSMALTHSDYNLHPPEKIIQKWHWIHPVCSCIQGFD